MLGAGGQGLGCCSAAISYCIISGRLTQSRGINVKPILIMLRSRPSTTFRSAALCFLIKVVDFICYQQDTY